VNIPLGELDLRARMEDRFDLPVAVENDANAATYGEFRAGAGRDAQTMVMLTLGTGVGGGVVIDGELYRGWAEFGHIVIEYDGVPCQGTCTGRGHLEAYVSGTAATRVAQEAFGPAVDSHRLVRLATEGDELAVELLTGIGRRLGAGIGSLVNIFDPQLVVIGGGFAAAGDFLFEPAHEVMQREALAPESDRVRIVRAELGTTAGLIGAGLLAFGAAASV
jgi:glucokinase